MKFLLLTTHQYGKDDLRELERLVSSVKSQVLKAGDEIELWCLMQGAAEQRIDSNIVQPQRTRYFWTLELMPLSQARNKLIAKILSEDGLFVLFPDDDCSYRTVFSHCCPLK